MIENLETGIIEYSPDFLVTLVNPKAEQILGIKKEDVLGTVIHPDIIRIKIRHSRRWRRYSIRFWLRMCEKYASKKGRPTSLK